MTIKFIADSAADLPESIIEKYDIDVFPLYVHHGDEHYKDGVEMSADKLYENMKKGESYKTSQVAVNDFIEKFEEYAKQGDCVIYLSLSSELSGTYQSAVLAKNQVKEKYPDFDLALIDSKSASMGIGLAIYNLVREHSNKNLSKDAIIEKAIYYATHMEHIFTVDDLDYLVKGGRLNKVAGFVGGILNIKPIIEIKNGKLEQLEKKKGSKRVMKRIIELVEERGSNLSEQSLGIVHADNKEVAEKLKEKIKEKTNCKEVVISEVGAVIGAHTGPGTYGIFFINDNKKINKVQMI